MKKDTLRKNLRIFFRIIFSRAMLITLLLLLNITLVFTFLFELIQGLPYLFSSMVVFTGVMEFLVINSKNSTSIKLTWAVIIAVLPVFGATLYILIHFDFGNRVNRKMIGASMEAGKTHIPEQRDLYQQIHNSEPELEGIARYLRDQAGAPAFQNTQVTYFPLGEDKFQEMLLQLEQAEHFIFMEYFIISRGYMWDSILEILERKAAQGVEIRLLYDGMNAFLNLPGSYPKELAKKGIQCKLHAPVRPFVSTHYNNRDHRKILIIDGHTAFTGGINLEDCYINREERYGHWKDTAVMLKGEAVRSFTLMFLQMWNATERNRAFLPYVSIPATVSAPGYVIPYGDSPIDQERVGEMVYLNLLNQAKDHVWIMTPYLILDSEMNTALKFAAKRGVDVRLILPHIPDKKSAFALARIHYKELMEAGVKIYEYTPGFVHAKVFLCDGIHGVVGTINLDYRSLYHHFECGAYLYRVPALDAIRKDFLDTFSCSQRVTKKELDQIPLGSKILGALLKLFAPLM